MCQLCAATWFLFVHVVWPTYDTYCDIGLALYCLSHGVRLWGVVMTLPILSTFCTSLAAYLWKRRTGDVQSGTVWSGEGFALPLLIWPQIQASKVGMMMWRKERGWQQRKRKFDRDESTIEGVVEGVAQCFIAAFIIIQKYMEHDERYGYRAQDYKGAERESFGIITLVFIVASALGSLLTGILGVFYFMLRGPIKIELGQSFGNKVLLFVTIVFGMASRFGYLATVFMFATSFERQEGTIGFFSDLLMYAGMILIFVGLQLVLTLIPLTSLGWKKFSKVLFSFPQILVVTIVTPFTFGLTCDSGCCCHCCCCCGCSKPRLALSKSLSLVNHIITLLLMIPPVIFFDFISSWDMGAAQLCIAVLGLLAAPILLFQPGRINMLGVLDPDNVQQQFLAEVKGGGCVFRLDPIQEELPLPEEAVEDGNETEEMKSFVPQPIYCSLPVT